MYCAVRIEFAVIAGLELENFRIAGCICTFVSSFAHTLGTSLLLLAVTFIKHHLSCYLAYGRLCTNVSIKFVLFLFDMSTKLR